VDTGGATCYQNLRPQWIKDSDIIFVVFNDSLPNSLYEAEEILHNDRGSRPAILVRNKFGPRSKEHLSARDLASKNGCAYFELSATDREQVTELFAVATRLFEKRTTISSDPNAAICFDRDRIRVTTTLEQEVEQISLVGRYLRLKRHRQRRIC
jgi:predicted GTPase